MDTLLVQDCGRSLQEIFGDRAVAWLTGPENLKLRIGMLEHEENEDWSWLDPPGEPGIHWPGLISLISKSDNRLLKSPLTKIYSTCSHWLLQIKISISSRAYASISKNNKRGCTTIWHHWQAAEPDRQLPGQLKCVFAPGHLASVVAHHWQQQHQDRVYIILVIVPLGVPWWFQICDGWGYWSASQWVYQIFSQYHLVLNRSTFFAHTYFCWFFQLII